MVQPITAARETPRRDGLAGAVGWGVVTAGTEAVGAVTPANQPLPETLDGIPAPLLGPGDREAGERGPETDGNQPIPPAERGSGDPLDPQSRWFASAGYQLHSDDAGCNADPYTFDPGECARTGRTWGDARPLYTVLDNQHAFAIGAGVKCSTLTGIFDMAYWQTQAQRGLELSQWSQIAHELWTGARADLAGHTANARLAGPEATLIAGGAPLDVLEAVAAMEDWLGFGSYGAVQMIHTPRKLVPYLQHAYAVSTSPGNGRIFTPQDTLIVADRGYPGTGPNGEEPTGSQFWIYGTGVLTARLGAIRFPERGDLSYATNAPTNDIEVHAERPAAIGWLCNHFAALVDLSLAPGSTAGLGGDGLASA